MVSIKPLISIFTAGDPLPNMLSREGWLRALSSRVNDVSTLASSAYNFSVEEYFCYILECADSSFYTGWTKDPERRLREHNAGHGARYTRARRPLRLVYLELQDDIRAAMKRERAIKSLTRAAKQALIDEYRRDEGIHD